MYDFYRQLLQSVEGKILLLLGLVNFSVVILSMMISCLLAFLPYKFVYLSLEFLNAGMRSFLWGPGLPYISKKRRQLLLAPCFETGHFRSNPPPHDFLFFEGYFFQVSYSISFTGSGVICSWSATGCYFCLSSFLGSTTRMHLEVSCLNDSPRRSGNPFSHFSGSAFLISGVLLICLLNFFCFSRPGFPVRHMILLFSSIISQNSIPLSPTEMKGTLRLSLNK